MSDVQSLRAEKAQLEAAVAELGQRGARMQHSLCGAPGDTKRFCVLVPKKPEMFVDQKDKSLAYVAPVGYLGNWQTGSTKEVFGSAELKAPMLSSQKKRATYDDGFRIPQKN